jgi:hypothetical protein
MTDYPDSQSLAVHARLLTHYVSARIIAAFFLGTLALRVAMGRWSWLDLLGPAIVLALEPFTEWTIHVFLLHFRPRRILGKERDPYVARKHRAHHQDPRDVELVLVPTRAIAIGLPIAALATALFGRNDPPRAVSTLAFGYLMLLTYEWTHFLIHSKYRPKRWYYRVIWRNHRNHHFRNEHYWFGVTTDIGDRLLRTAPERDAVPVSPTAKDLAAAWD